MGSIGVKLENWNGQPGTISMPLKSNIPDGKPDWTLVNCPICGAECWEHPEQKEMLKVPGMIAACTNCAIKRGIANPPQPIVVNAVEDCPNYRIGHACVAECNLKELPCSRRLKQGHLAPFQLMKAPLDTCPECARKHDPEQPHDAMSMLYQYSFYDKNGRWPTWADAIAHCSLEVKRQWVDALTKHGIQVTTD